MLDAGVVRGPIADDPSLNDWILQRDDLSLAIPAHHRLGSQRYFVPKSRPANAHTHLESPNR